MKYRLTSQQVETINKRLEHATKKHPEGAGLHALYAEIGEVVQAMIEKQGVDVVYELYDVVTVALRMIIDRETNHE